jgi:hypothetical protein
VSTDLVQGERYSLPARFAQHAAPRATLYLTGCTNPLTREAAQTQDRLGMLAQPGNAYHRQHAQYARWGIDNGAFGHARKVAQGKAQAWGEAETDAYIEYLRKVTREADTSQVLFATAPDVLRFVCLTHDVADEARELSCKLQYTRKEPDAAGRACQGVPFGEAAATWERSSRIFSRIRELDLPAALVAQDGIDASSIDWDAFDVLFIGGSDQFKLGAEAAAIVATAKAHGKWVHFGRVSSQKRFDIAVAFGCDSADGTYIGFGPAKNTPNVLRWLATTEPATFQLAA